MERDDWDSLFDELYLETYARLQEGVDSEAQALAAVAAGFDAVEAFGGLDGGELSERAWRLALMARVAVG